MGESFNRNFPGGKTIQLVHNHNSFIFVLWTFQSRHNHHMRVDGAVQKAKKEAKNTTSIIVNESDRT